MGVKTKIDWCDSTWNPVTGCLHGCEYCYARKIAERFGGATPTEYGKTQVLDELNHDAQGRADVYPFGFLPTLHRYKLNEPQKWKKPRTIFVCSMADLFGDWVPDDWIKQVFDACEAAPQHRYIFLTKNPKKLCEMAHAAQIDRWNKKHPNDQHPQTGKYAGKLRLPEHDNWWFGSSLDNKNAIRFDGGHRWNSFVSLEPLTEFMNVGIGSFGGDQWIIIGAETGNRKGKIVPEKAWVENIVEAAKITRAAVFMKESLREIMGKDFRQEFPWEDNA